MEGSFENSKMRESEEDRSRLAAFSYFRETEIMIAMKTAAGGGTGEATQREGRRLGRNLTFYLPGESFVYLSFFFVLWG